MRILFASLPADGHFNPLTGIAVGLARRGHDVRWYAGPEYGRRIDGLGMAWFPYHRAREVTGDSLNRLFPERTRLKGPGLIAFDLDALFVANVSEQFDDIVSIRERFPFDLFFCDGGLYVEQLVAVKLGVPVFATAMSTVLPGPGSPPPFFGLRPARTMAGRTVHRAARKLLALTMRKGVTHYNDILAEHGVAPIPADGFPSAPMASARRLFLNGTPGLEYPGYRSPAGAEFVGPLPPAVPPDNAGTPLPTIVTDPGNKVIVVSQGTVDNSDLTKLIIPTLKAFAGSPYVVVATTGGTDTKELRDRFAGSRMVIEDHLPYAALFSHADAFVSNGGWGSTVFALRGGVPVVAAGTREGKNDINARIAYNGLGVDLRTERPTASRILRAVRHALDDSLIRTNISRLRAEFEHYDPIPRIADAVEALPGRPPPDQRTLHPTWST